MANPTSTSNSTTTTPSTLKRKRPTKTKPKPKSSSTALSRPRPKKPRPKKSRSIECPICLQPTPPQRLHTLTTCSCTYCKSCLTEAFTVGLSHATYPSRCCGRPIELVTVEKYVDRKVARAYKRMGEEVRADVPVYCARVGCGGFVGEGVAAATVSVQDVSETTTTGDGERDRFLTCGKCHMKTCARGECRRLKEEHLGIHGICPGMLEDEGVKKVREEKGWKRCPRCWVLVERSSGCDRIRCMCKAEWCYTCGKMAKGKDACVCHMPGYVDLVGEGGEEVDVELPSLEQIFGIEGNAGMNGVNDRAESMPVVESVEVEG